MTSSMGVRCTRTSYMLLSSASVSIPWLMVRLPWGSMSTASTRRPCSRSAAPRFTVDVVLATPPFWFANATSPAAPAGLVVEILIMTAVAGESSGLGLLRRFRGLGAGSGLVGCDLFGLVRGRRVGLVDHVVVGGLDVLVLVLVLHDAGDRGDGALEAAGLGALGDLELHPVVTDLGDRAEDAADGNDLVALLEHRDHLRVSLALTTLGPDGQEIEDPEEHQDPDDDGRASSHAAQPPAEYRSAT